MGILCRLSDPSADAIRLWLDATLGEARITKMSTLHQSGPAEGVQPIRKATSTEQGLHRFWHRQR